MGRKYYELPKMTTSLIHNSGGVQESYSHEIFLFCNESDRINSFAEWPVTFLSPRLMASAGFYYLKIEDIVRCAFCRVQIGSWVPGDDPLRDHKRWAPSCRFVRKIPLGNVLANNSIVSDDKCIRIQFGSEYGINDCETEVKKKKNERAKGENKTGKTECKICFSDEIGVVFLPCRHIVACVTCALSLKNCAVCRREVTAAVRVFLS